MEKPTNRRKGLAVAGLGVTGSLLFAGCSSGGEETPAPEVSEQISTEEDKYAPMVTTKYFPNGTRRVYIGTFAYGSDAEAIITGYCEGGDLVEVTTVYRGVGEMRSVGHAACADNRLTQQDFPPLPQ